MYTTRLGPTYCELKSKISNQVRFTQVCACCTLISLCAFCKRFDNKTFLGRTMLPKLSSHVNQRRYEPHEYIKDVFITINSAMERQEQPKYNYLTRMSCSFISGNYTSGWIKLTTLTLKVPNKNCSRQHFNFLLLSFKENKAGFFL